jgi:AAA+ ATPase superfamily predicted ATPase
MLQFEDYDEVFTPGAPIRIPALFVGRSEQMQDLLNFTARPGLHPLVIGSRGIGKTSLVRQAFPEGTVPVVWITCNSRMSFDMFARAVLDELKLDVTATITTEEKDHNITGKASPFGLGASVSESRKQTVQRTGPGSLQLDSWLLYKRLCQVGEKVLIVIDEFDKVPRSRTDFHTGVAELIKTLADNQRHCDSRVILVGIAGQAREILAGHQSIERSVREIYLPPLSRKDLREFLDTAERELGFTFAHSVKDEILDNSLGYPYYVHLLGLECIDVMRKRDAEARRVTEGDYEKAVRKAASRAFRTELRKYESTIRELGSTEVGFIKQLVELLAKGPVRQSELMSMLDKQGTMTLQSAQDTLSLLCKKSLLYVSKNKGEVRFADPLMFPFLRSLISTSERKTTTTADQLQLFTEYADKN